MFFLSSFFLSSFQYIFNQIWASKPRISCIKPNISIGFLKEKKKFHLTFRFELIPLNEFNSKASIFACLKMKRWPSSNRAETIRLSEQKCGVIVLREISDASTN